MADLVTVVVPSYNRAQILPQTLPTYLQPEVGELIVVDDCSTDNTPQVVAALIEQYPRIKYLRNPVNSKQGFTKNRGIEAAQYDYLYFGDDDSYIAPGSIGQLLETMHRYQADIVGAQALYSNNPRIEFDRAAHPAVRTATHIKQLVDLSTLAVDFSLAFPEPVEVPLCQACFICRTQLAKELLFDVRYQGNAYREETDFLVRASLGGKKIVYDSSVVQINLPRMMATGGAHAGTPQEWFDSAIENNNYFLDKNYAAMQAKWNLPHTIDQMRELFAQEMRHRAQRAHRYDWLRTIGLYKPLKYIKKILS